MTDEHGFRGLLQRATHRIPGVPAHADRHAVGDGSGDGGRTHRSLNRRWNHSPSRPPRVMPGWQRRIAAIFGREL